MNNTKNKEIWKPIQNYENLYAVSNHGRIKSLSRMIKSNHDNCRFQHEKILNQLISDNGYCRVILYKNSIPTTMLVHRLVAKHFVNNPNPKIFLEVNHKDENKSNNYASNLEWCTHDYNIKYSCSPCRTKNRNHKKDLQLLITEIKSKRLSHQQ